MSNRTDTPAPSAGSAYGLKFHGLHALGVERWNLLTPDLYEAALARGEGHLSAHGALVLCNDGPGRAHERLVVQEAVGDSAWWSECNQPISEARFFGLHARVAAYLQGRDVFVQDCHVGIEQPLPVRVITETASHSLAARNLFMPLRTSEEMGAFVPEFTVIWCPLFRGALEVDGTSSFAALHLGARMGLLCGTSDARDLEDLVAAAMTYLLPMDGILPLPCRVDAGRHVFMGKGGLALAKGSAFHAWSDNGISAIFSGSCIESEADAADHFGCVTCPSGASGGGWQCVPSEGEGGNGHPSHLFLLVNDESGTLPLIARLTPAQAAYYFLCAYGLRLASKGPLKDAFGSLLAPVRHPGVYADMLLLKLKRHGTRCWLVNTGLRQAEVHATLEELRRAVDAAADGTLYAAPWARNPVFGFEVPAWVPDCREVLVRQGPEGAQRELASRLAASASRLAGGCSPEVLAAGPATQVR